MARAGARSNGVEHARDAVARGASAVMIERGAVPAVNVPLIEVEDIRRAIGLAAEAVHGHPSRALRVIGITGTNGKTTSSCLVQSAIDGAGASCGRLGTLGYALGVDRVDSPLTTPEADELSRYAARVRERGGTHLVMEVSSHALAQARADALTFAVAAFTNLTQDHLDFHGSLERYAEAKTRLFTELQPGASVVNVDDPVGQAIARVARGRTLRVGRRADADVRPVEYSLDARGLRARVATPAGEVELVSRLVGEHNLDNLLLVLGVIVALELDVGRAAAAMAHAPAVPGRLERCDVPVDDLVVLVDYAHTPDALERALAAVRGLSEGQVICVFGCGGDRDPFKRPKMGERVGRGADRAIITNDNPRSEEPSLIASAIEAGLAPSSIPYEVELDRALAIERAIAEAAPGDVVLIAGKGHEPYQLIGGERHDFDDRVHARRALARRRERAGR